MAAPRWLWPAVAVVVAGGAIYLSGRDVKSPEGNTLVRDATIYQDANSRARALTLAAFVASDTGGEITAKMRDELNRAIPFLIEMNRYAPIKVGSYFALGKTYMLLGRLPEAGRALEQAILNETADAEERNTPALKATVVESKALLAEVLLDLAVQNLRDAGALPAADASRLRVQARTMQERALGWATEAVRAEPDGPRYLAAQASALLALGRAAEAKPVIARAVSLAPDHFKVKPLAALVRPR